MLYKARYATVCRVNTLTYSQRGLDLTKRFEAAGGPNLTAYWDDKGHCWTIGYGHTGPDVHQGLTWVVDQCNAALVRDVQFAEHCVNTLVTVALSQNQFDALVDFVFNEGCGNFKQSSLLRFLNKGFIAQASAEFPKWHFAGGVDMPGLLVRRLAERTLFDSAA